MIVLITRHSSAEGKWVEFHTACPNKTVAKRCLAQELEFRDNWKGHEWAFLRPNGRDRTGRLESSDGFDKITHLVKGATHYRIRWY